MTELLAPAGSMEALRAAIANGANAVYLGGKNFSARAFAENFSLEQIEEAVQQAHFYNVKVYVAVNTLAADNELPAAVQYVAELYRLGVDAVIVQDLGLIDLLRQAFPDLPLHASTQMTVHDASGTRILNEMGIERVILARELSFKDMAAVRQNSATELEAFVHGALCVCYSGQCLFSSLVGGRSGNRGRCAQPCRMAFSLTDAYDEVIPTSVEGKYLLSPRDLFGYSELQKLHALNLSSWKIEGRMKKAEYVATVCRIYSALLAELEDGEPTGGEERSKEDIRQLMQVFNRDRSTGYWLGNPGAALMSFSRPNNRGLFLGRITESDGENISIRLSQPLNVGDGIEIWQTGKREGCVVQRISVDGQVVKAAAAEQIATIPATAGRTGDRVFKTYDCHLMGQAQYSYHQLRSKPVQFVAKAKIGETLSVSAQDEDGFSMLIETDYKVKKSTSGIDARDVAESHLGRLGGTNYYLQQLRGEIDAAALLPPSVLNKVRREIVEALQQQREAMRPKRVVDKAAVEKVMQLAAPAERHGAAQRRMGYSVLAATEKTARTAGRYAMDVYLDISGFDRKEVPDVERLAADLSKQGSRLAVYLPQVILPHEETRYAALIKRWNLSLVAAAVVNNLGHIRFLRESGWTKDVYAGSGLNTFNSATCTALSKLNVSRVMLSPELTLEQLKKINSAGLETEYFGQGALQVMVSEYCALGAACGLRNRDGKGFTPCTRPCQKQERVFLTDEKSFRFPLAMDNACRMHVFNSREHCLLDEIPALQEAGVNRLLLDMRLYDKQKQETLLSLYNQAIKDDFAFFEAKRRLKESMRGFTKGHLYRGV